ncbi:MAG TPA: YdcF family protein [Terracidiphilus sp.]|nr:YdcF family protein [Terracidiphilus sp.]
MGSKSQLDLSRRKPRYLWLKAVLVVLLVLLLGGFAWCWWVYAQVERYAVLDEAAPSDAIGVFGAAEYDGHPSPVFRARLDHAHALYDRGIAPLIVTLGGDGGDDHSEGAVGREYLMGAGIPESAIIAETQSRSTSESARRIAVIARTNGLRRLVIVSDGTHLFRIHAICAADGLNVLTSPRPRSAAEVADAPDWDAMTHEIITYTLWRLHLD